LPAADAEPLSSPYGNRLILKTCVFFQIATHKSD
jgi:hypothetical protein